MTIAAVVGAALLATLALLAAALAAFSSSSSRAGPLPPGTPPGAQGNPSQGAISFDETYRHPYNASRNEDCVPVSARAPKDEAVNIILVPSKFNGDMHRFADRARWVVSIFDRFPPVNAASNNALNIWYVPHEVAGDQGQHCWFGCSGIARLLCCQTPQFLALADTYCGAGLVRNVLVVHDDATYGGAGYTDQSLGTTSVHPQAPYIAVHETGHSLFNFADEYQYGWGTSVSPNCDGSSCAKWSDLYGRGWGVGCVPGCQNGQYFVAEQDTLMRVLSGKFEEANERDTCCKYYFYSADLAPYCHKFNSGGLDLWGYCQREIWGRSLPAWHSSNREIGHLPALAADPQGLNYSLVSQPVAWRLTQGSRGEWTCQRVGRQRPGLYPRANVEGDSTHSPGGRALRALGPAVRVEARRAGAASGGRVLTFRSGLDVEIPPDLADGHFKHGHAYVNRTAIDVTLPLGESCHVLPV